MIADAAYVSVGLAVDPDGRPHFAAAQDGVIWYLHQADEGWAREQLTPSGSSYARSAIVRDRDGSLWVAFGAYSTSEFGDLPAGVFYVTNRSGTWSVPVELPARDASDFSFLVRDGSIHLAYVSGFHVDVVPDDPSLPVHYLTDATGSFSDVLVAANGSKPVIGLGEDGRPHITFEADERLHYAVTDASGAFGDEEIPGVGGYGPQLALGTGGRVHLVWAGWTDEDCCPPDVLPLYYAQRAGDAWSPGELLIDDGGWSHVLAADGQGDAHVAAGGSHDGVWYVTDRDGAFRAEELSSDTQAWVAIDIDGQGRPHVAYVRHGTPGIWYAVGPTP